jgi:hypothetical protein
MSDTRYTPAAWDSATQKHYESIREAEESQERFLNDLAEARAEMEADRRVDDSGDYDEQIEEACGEAIIAGNLAPTPKEVISFWTEERRDWKKYIFQQIAADIFQNLKSEEEIEVIIIDEETGDSIDLEEFEEYEECCGIYWSEAVAICARLNQEELEKKIGSATQEATAASKPRRSL